MEVSHKPEIIPGPEPGPPLDGFPPNKRGGFRGRGGLMRGGPLRGRGGPGGFPRGGLPMRGPMVGRGGPPGRGALRLVAPGGFMPIRGGIPGRGRGDMGPLRGDGRGGMYRGEIQNEKFVIITKNKSFKFSSLYKDKYFLGRGGRGGPPGRGAPPGGIPRGFGGPPRPGGPPRGPPGLPPRGMNRPPRVAVPPQTQQPGKYLNVYVYLLVLCQGV